MKRFSILLGASSLFAVACALPDLPVPIDGAGDSKRSAEGAPTEAATGEQPDGDATAMTHAEAGDAAVEAPADATVASTDASTVGTDSAPEGGPMDSGPDGGPTCTTACTKGLTQCASGVVQTCQAQANGCTQWVTTATCGSHQTCTASTADGGAVACACNASQCTEIGTVCQNNQTVATCAKDADGCFYASSTSPCATPMFCSGMPPSAACSLTCTNSCTQGQTSCVNDQVATCTLGSDGCYSYGAPAACPSSHQICTGTAGSAACTCSADPTCIAVGDVCATTTTLATCAKDAQNCIYKTGSETCASGGCSAAACCASGYQQACNSACGITLCSGACSNTTANVGTACNHTCGTIQCSGACSNTTANVGGPCGSCSGTIMCNGNCSAPLLTHSNGVGGTYLDCNPLDTYGAQAASEACASVVGDLSTCQSCTNNCGQGGPGPCLEITYNGMMYNWLYGPPLGTGTVFEYTASGANGCGLTGTYSQQGSGSWN